MRILLIEDDPDLAHWLSKALHKNAGFNVEWVNDGLLAYKQLHLEEFDAIVLDLGIPSLDGYSLLNKLRTEDNHTPILVLTARDSLATRVNTLDSGADDFLPKPFMMEELIARLSALIRRSRGKDKPSMSCGSLRYDTSSKCFFLASIPLSLTPRESEVLRILLQKSGEPINKQFILDRLTNIDEHFNLDAIEVIIHRLRKKLHQSDIQITTLRGIGYCLEPVTPPLSNQQP
ncbi:response regulator [Pelistega sp. NLN82]|uniref:Response regulator n=1 Tax=Pelistega ratti TaxID=2652177 RepID=A0A6L9Y6V3_9BURK|nr:response regulator [Pelistega ratti]NEN76149.1 response regulator [Pelistega ratti]